MEVFVRNLPFNIDRLQFIEEIARVVHGRVYGRNADETPINFEVTLRRPNKNRKLGISLLTGTVIFPTLKIGNKFLRDFGGERPKNSINFGNHPQPALFKRSKFPPKPKILELIQREPYRTADQRRQLQLDQGNTFDGANNLQGIQFGWECRDNVFSVKWESAVSSPTLRLDDTKHQVIITHSDGENYDEIIILFSQIHSIYMNESPEEQAILLNLLYPVQYRSLSEEPSDPHSDFPIIWHRKPALSDRAQARVAPYTSIAIRLLFSSSRHLHEFRQKWTNATNWRIDAFDYDVEKRNLFSQEAIEEVAGWVNQLDWPLAFYVDSLVTDCCLDPMEVMLLRPDIQRLIAGKGLDFTHRFIMCFKDELQHRWYSDLTQSHESAKECFERLLAELKTFQHRTKGPAEDLFECLHVIVTPTKTYLEGPCMEGTNRIIRSYPTHADAFLRVSFEDENKTRFLLDRQVDGRRFISERVGTTLRNGLTVGGRHFEFLAYSQSALKEHAVWFVSRFWDETKSRWVDAKSIIEGIGSFDSELVRCPARYAARISQAFTTTDSSVEVNAEEIFCDDDIARNNSNFTDGVGTISLSLAEEIWRSLKAKKRRGYGGNRPRSRAFQIRFQGSKGMVTVDYKLSGRVLVLRPSMVKFESHTSASTPIEIARVFNNPGRMFLNRPLVMLLENLGVPADTFLRLQKEAVRKIRHANTSMIAARSLIDVFGLGSSFRLSPTLLHLEQLKRTPMDDFYKSFVRLCVLHALREVKYKARIPVPGWTLVGVADIHSYLKEGQVFVCIERREGKPTYLSGPVSISRSPTIHPGDVQMAYAIGSPPPDSPFVHERLSNTIVFSTLGERSLPSMLGGGDLDGDLYNITDYAALHPRFTHPAAEYDPAKKKMLDRPSTMDDVIDFVVDFMYSDNVGIIATNWLLIADEYEICDHDCLKLARLHSDAVDFPKSGLPVPMQEIPSPDDRSGQIRRPDWNEPETGFKRRMKVYESATAIGLLFRDVDLPRIYKKKGDQLNLSHRNLRGDNSDSDIDSDLDLPVHGQLVDDNDGLTRVSSLHKALLDRVSEFVLSTQISNGQQAHLDSVFFEYAQRLKQICYTHSLNRYRSLTEEEALVGTIKARTSNPRRRRDTIAKLREQTRYLVADIIFEITGEDEPTEKRLKVALAAWELAQSKNEQFGAKSFAWIALVALFDAIKAAGDEDLDIWVGLGLSSSSII